MKKIYRLENLDCANCAAKMERGIKKIKGVNDASVNFMMLKMTIDVDDNIFDEVFEEIKKVCKKVEPDLIIK